MEINAIDAAIAIAVAESENPVNWVWECVVCGTGTGMCPCPVVEDTRYTGRTGVQPQPQYPHEKSVIESIEAMTIPLLARAV